MYWLRNPNSVVLDLSFLRDARHEPLVWTGAGTAGSRRVVTAEMLDNPHVLRLVHARVVVPDPAYDAEHTGRDLGTLQAAYAKAFEGRVTVEVSAPVVAAPPAPVVEAVVEAPPAPVVEAPVEAPAEAPAEAPVEAPMETATDAPADAPADAPTDTPRKKKR